VTANGYVKNHEEWLVVDPFARHIVRCERKVLRIVHVPANFFRLPFDSVFVKLRGIRSTNQDVAGPDATDAAAAGATWTMNGAMYSLWLAADVFHYFNFATVGPVGLFDLVVLVSIK
jgi:hypothetical protein